MGRSPERRWGAVVAAIAVVLAGAGAASRAVAAPGESSRPIANPDLAVACGIDIHMILDESGSVRDYANDVRSAFRAFTSALNNTGSRVAVSEFSTVARLPLPGPAANSYTVVTDATQATVFEPYISNGYRPDGSTHWEDAFRVARYLLPRPGTQPHLVVFITDGDPNEIVREDHVTYDPGNPSTTQNEYEHKVPLSSNEVTSAGNTTAKNRAVPNANALKAQGSHILTVAVGSGLSSQDSLNRIIDVSGPDVFSGSGTFDIATDDVYRVADFADLEEAMREAAFQLCAPSITVRKLIDLTPDPGPNDTVPGPGWDMTITSDPAPASWVLPATATGNSATVATDGNGFATFQWTTALPVSSNITVAEEDPGGVPPGFVLDSTRTSCTQRTPDDPDDRPLPVIPTMDGFSATVTHESIVTCEVVNRAPPEPEITLEKETNGADADAPPGPSIPAGDPVNWNYRVTNTGNVTLSDIAVTDDQGVAVTCPPGSIAPGGEMTCTASGTATAGQYANLGTVTANDPFGTTVTASDPSHYVGAQPGIDVEKATNGEDADQWPGEFIPVGDPVTWTYVVRNTGNDVLTGVAVVDNQGVLVSCPSTTLDVGASMPCTAPAGVAAPGPYENVATATAVGDGVTVEDSDPSHYFGEEPSVTIEKSTNGEDADLAPGPSVQVGGRVEWLYEVTNTGNVPLVWNVTDDRLPGVICPRPVLGAGQTAHCRGPVGVAQAGQYENTATVEGTSPAGQEVSDSDPSHYFGEQGAIDLEKLTNGIDADQPPGPFVAVGGAVTWTYRVTNTGNSDLTDVEVIDFEGETVMCPQTSLAVGASMDCTAAGVAAAGEYTNFAVALGATALDDVVFDADPSHHYGAEPGIHLEKSTNGVDADEPPGPYIPVGDPVDWSYRVINTGNDDLTNIAVTDDRGVAVSCPGDELAAGEQMICTGAGTSVRGQYENTATVTAVDPLGATVDDTDPSHYFGAVSSLHVEKLTNGVDADDPTGPRVRVGDRVTWLYLVTNPGNLAIHDVALTDSTGVAPVFSDGDTDGDGKLDPGETWRYLASTVAAAGQAESRVTATGLDELEDPVTDDDPTHHIADPPPTPPPTPPTPPDASVRPALDLDKRAARRRVRGGGSLRFRLRVRNTGNATARRVRVCDRLPAGLRFVRVDRRRICFNVRRLRAGRSRTFTVRTRTTRTLVPLRLCNVGTRAAAGVRMRRVRACVRVLPAAQPRPPACPSSAFTAFDRLRPTVRIRLSRIC
jgi:uncharacterized repeat protein (TIGR01451 family)